MKKKAVCKLAGKNVCRNKHFPDVFCTLDIRQTGNFSYYFHRKRCFLDYLPANVQSGKNLFRQMQSGFFFEKRKLRVTQPSQLSPKSFFQKNSSSKQLHLKSLCDISKALFLFELISLAAELPGM